MSSIELKTPELIVEGSSPATQSTDKNQLDAMSLQMMRRPASLFELSKMDGADQYGEGMPISLTDLQLPSQLLGQAPYLPGQDHYRLCRMIPTSCQPFQLEESFFLELHRQLYNVNRFYTVQEQYLRTQVNHIIELINSKRTEAIDQGVASATAILRAEVDSIAAALKEIYRGYVDSDLPINRFTTSSPIVVSRSHITFHVPISLIVLSQSGLAKKLPDFELYCIRYGPMDGLCS
jgi:hypothetical protein